MSKLRNFLLAQRVLLGLFSSLAFAGFAHAAQPDQQQKTGADLTIFKKVVVNPNTGKEHSLVTIYLSNGVPITATAIAVEKADANELHEARLFARKTQPSLNSEDNAATCNDPFTDLVDTDLILETAQVWVYQLTYSTGAQQLMTINKNSGDVTFGPVVGGSDC
ncbi:MAG: hypothetical protein AAGD92_11360 [Pseudomonadota bacterium]